MNFCQCGCGQVVERTFAPGHDAKRKSQLLKAARLGDAAAIAELQTRGWLHFLSGNASRKFGVELEVIFPVGTSGETIAQALRDAGVDASYMGYTHQVVTGWKVVTDGSLSHNGFEIVSPVLAGYRHLQQVRKVATVLRRLQGRIDKSCGFHAHHDIADLSRDDVLRLVENYANSQGSIDSALPLSRRTTISNQYCRPWTPSEVAYLRQATTVEEMAARQGSRYKTINLQSYPRYGTVEFRQAAGTIEADKIVNWVKFGQQMIDAAKAGRQVTTYTQATYGPVLDWMNGRQRRFLARAA